MAGRQFNQLLDFAVRSVQGHGLLDFLISSCFDGRWGMVYSRSFLIAWPCPFQSVRSSSFIFDFPRFSVADEVSFCHLPSNVITLSSRLV